MDRLDKAFVAFIIIVVVIPQAYIIIVSDSLEAVAAKLAIVTAPLLCGFFAAFGWVVNTIIKATKGRG